MTEIDINGWSVEQDQDRTILLTSPGGELVANRDEGEKPKQTWFIDLELQGQEPKSWQVQVDSKEELFTQTLPEILSER